MPHHVLRCAQMLSIQLLFVTTGLSDCAGTDVMGQSDSILANGKMSVCWKRTSERLPKHLFIHFHGAKKTVREAFERSDVDAVLVIINFPGLSTAYSKPFAEDAQLFAEILDRAKQGLPPELVDASLRWERISLSSFSAGYGAIREILKSPEHFRQVDDIVAADSIYAGLDAKQSGRQVDEKNMRDFLKFARKAVERRKRFTISHSMLVTPYASTVETAGYLLQSLKVERRKVKLMRADAFKQMNEASAGHFTVWGFEGVTGQAHMLHLQHIDIFWNTLVASEVDSP